MAESLLSRLLQNTFTEKESAADRWSPAGNDTPVNVLFCYLKRGICCVVATSRDRPKVRGKDLPNKQ